MANPTAGQRKRRALAFIAGAPDAPKTPPPDAAPESLSKGDGRMTIGLNLSLKMLEKIDLIAYAEGKTRDATIRSLLKQALKE